MEHVLLFNISNVLVRITADNPVIFDIVKVFFSGYSFKHYYNDKKSVVTINIYSSKKSPISHIKETTTLFKYGRIKGYRLDANTLMFCDNTTFVFVKENISVADVYMDMSILNRGTEFVSIFLTLALIELLRYKGLYYLHASALKKGNHAILLCGMGMSGKTTLSLGLVSKGYLLCSDDAVFLKQRVNRVQAIGFKKDIHVTKQTLKIYSHMFEDIKPPVPPVRKAFIPYKRFQTVSSVIPDILIFLQRVDSSTTHISPIEKTKAMSLLIPQSLMVFFKKEIANKHIDILKALIYQAKPYLCLCGKDILKNPLIILKEISNT
ncbi:MAG: hypothetical protein ACP5QW_07575 [bacterium]